MQIANNNNKKKDKSSFLYIKPNLYKNKYLMSMFCGKQIWPDKYLSLEVKHNIQGQLHELGQNNNNNNKQTIKALCFLLHALQKLM